MRTEDFSDSPSGYLVDAQLTDRSPSGDVQRVRYQALMPHPLPPEMAATDRLISALADASHALGELSGLGHNLPNPHLLIQPFIRKEAVLSSKIEGTQTNIKELYAYEAAQRARGGVGDDVGSSDVREVVNYVHALSYALAYSRERGITLSLVRELHRLLMTGVRGHERSPGEFRGEQVWIGAQDCSVRDARFVPPPPLEVRPVMEELERYMTGAMDQTPALIRMAYIHYQFETIHPFMDGNGRIGRLLIPLLLIHGGQLSEPLLYLSAFFERHRSTYYDLLLAVSQHGTWADWVEFFLQGVAVQARDGLVRARRLQDLQGQWRAQLLSTGRSGNLIRLMEELFHSPVLTISDAINVLGVSHTAAASNLQRLVEAGMVEEIPSTYRRQFISLPVIEAIEGSIDSES